MHTAQDGDKRLAELWDKHKPDCEHEFSKCSIQFRDMIRKFAADLVDDKFQLLQDECLRLKQHEACSLEWLRKTEWVQDSPNTRFAFSPIGMHRADVMRKHIGNLEAKLAVMKAAKTRDTPDAQPEPAETEDERMGRECYEEWRAGDKGTLTWEGLKEEFYGDWNLWIAFAKRRPKVVPPAAKLREPGQVLCDALFFEGLLSITWDSRLPSTKEIFDRVARKLGIEAQP